MNQIRHENELLVPQLKKKLESINKAPRITNMNYIKTKNSIVTNPLFPITYHKVSTDTYTSFYGDDQYYVNRDLINNIDGNNELVLASLNQLLDTCYNNGEYGILNQIIDGFCYINDEEEDTFNNMITLQLQTSRNLNYQNLISDIPAWEKDNLGYIIATSEAYYEGIIPIEKIKEKWKIGDKMTFNFNFQVSPNKFYNDGRYDYSGMRWDYDRETELMNTIYNFNIDLVIVDFEKDNLVTSLGKANKTKALVTLNFVFPDIRVKSSDSSYENELLSCGVGASTNFTRIDYFFSKLMEEQIFKVISEIANEDNFPIVKYIKQKVYSDFARVSSGSYSYDFRVNGSLMTNTHYFMANLNSLIGKHYRPSYNHYYSSNSSSSNNVLFEPKSLNYANLISESNLQYEYYKNLNNLKNMIKNLTNKCIKVEDRVEVLDVYDMYSEDVKCSVLYLNSDYEITLNATNINYYASYYDYNFPTPINQLNISYNSWTGNLVKPYYAIFGFCI